MDTEQIRQLLNEADRADRQGRREDARRHFEAVIAIDESERNARNWLGADALSRSDALAAVTHFSVAATGEPGERSHWVNLAAAYRAQGDADGERHALSQALALDQTDLLVLVRFAELHERLGEDRNAAKRWAAVLQLAAHIGTPSPEFAAILDHANRFLKGQQRALADRIDRALADDLGQAIERDRRRMQRAADLWLGRRRIYSNECEGLHYPFLPADEFFDRDLYPWLDQLEAATATIVEELRAVLADPGADLTPYISLPPGVPDNKWSALDKSLSWGAFHLWKEGERFDAACARVPQTAAVIESLPMCRIDGRAPNVFFSILRAGSVIPPHTGVTNVRSVIHLPLIVPPDCGFRVGGETREWIVGQAFAFDDTIEHEAWNRSTEDRAVLITDAWNPYLSEHEQAMICRFYDAKQGDTA